MFFSIVFIACSKQDDEIYLDSNSEVEILKVNHSPIEKEIIHLVNSHRESIGLKPLITSLIVSNVSHSHTNYMIDVGEVNHDNFSERYQVLMSKENAINVGENVAYGYKTAEGVVRGWLNSVGHREIIENPTYTHFGISTEANSENRNYYTNIFMKK